MVARLVAEAWRAVHHTKAVSLTFDLEPRKPQKTANSRSNANIRPLVSNWPFSANPFRRDFVLYAVLCHLILRAIFQTCAQAISNNSFVSIIFGSFRQFPPNPGSVPCVLARYSYAPHPPVMRQDAPCFRGGRVDWRGMGEDWERIGRFRPRDERSGHSRLIGAQCLSVQSRHSFDLMPPHRGVT